MGQIGKPIREIQVEPLQIPVPTREPQQAPAPPVHVPEPVRVPA